MFDILFHWSPTIRRVAILQEGLKVYSEPSVQSGNLLWPYLCLSTRPSLAWGLSGAIANKWLEDPIEDWDLWEVRPPEGAEIHVREFWWPKFEEVKCYTSIPADRLWFVGQREDKLVAIEREKKPVAAKRPRRAAAKKAT